MSDPIVTISAKDMFEMVRSIEVSAGEIRSGVQELTGAVGRLEKIVEDHEDRLRRVEERADTTSRLDAVEGRVTDHDHAFTKQGERIGRLEARNEARLNPIAVAAVIGTFSAIVVSIILHLI